MNKKILGSAIVMAIAAAGVSTSASAALASNAVLNFTAPTLNSSGYVVAASGSWFAMDNNNSSSINNSERVGISSFNGLVLGTTQLATGSHAGVPNGSEGKNVDNAWAFFGNTGMHQTTSASTVLTAAGNTASVDLSGWNVTWNGIGSIPMGTGAWNPTAGAGTGATGLTNGAGKVTCAVDCAVGDTYTLNYSATVPLGDPSGFGGVKYYLHLQGTVAAGAVVNPIPVPAAAWLFGSGLLGLAGIARRRKTA